MKIRRGTIVVEQPIGGWQSGQFGSISAAVEVGKDKYTFSSALSLWRNGVRGHMAPGEVFDALSDSGTRVNDLPLNSKVASNGEDFSVLRTGRLVVFGVGDDTIDTNYDPTAHGGHTIASSENVDVEIIKDSSGTELVLSSWEDNADADVMKITSAGGGQVSNYLSGLAGGTVLLKGVPHIILQSVIAGKVLVTNGQYVVEIDVNAGTANMTKLPLGDGWVATSMRRRGNFIAILGYKSTTSISSFALSEVRTWLWNGYDPNPTVIYDIPDNFAGGLGNDNGVLLAFTQGRNNTTKVQRLDPRIDDQFKLIFESASIGSAPRHGSIENYQGAVHYGRKGGEALYVVENGNFHYRALVTDGTNQASDIGFVKNLSTNALYCGIKTGSVYKIFKINHSKYYVGAEFRSGLLALPFKGRITETRLYPSQFGTGASVTLSVFRNYVTAAVGGAADLMNKTLTNAALGAITEKKITKVMELISSFYFILTFNHASVSNTAAIVRRIEFDWEEVPGMP